MSRVTRGSGRSGEEDGRDFDQYERTASDGVFYGDRRREADAYAEQRYEEERCAEEARANHGYGEDDFVVSDECFD